jgi:hypothetical protein
MAGLKFFVTTSPPPPGVTSGTVGDGVEEAEMRPPPVEGLPVKLLEWLPEVRLIMDNMWLEGCAVMHMGASFGVGPNDLHGVGGNEHR